MERFRRGVAAWREALARSPALRDALIWTLPAILFGAVLRGLFLSYSPYAGWTADSMSFFEFAYKAHERGEWVINEKRRWLYPVFVWLVEWLPGSTLRWIAWLQHAAGLVTLVPLGYAIRKTLMGWRVFLPAITIVYAAFPHSLWFEHTLLAEAPMFMAIIWTFAGWIAWMSVPTRAARAWLFVAPLAAALLVRSAGRFLIPGMCAGLLMSGAWRHLRWPHWAVIALAVAGNLGAGKDKQVALLLYQAAFPLTQLETPQFAEYKAELREEVTRERRWITRYYMRDETVYQWLRDSGKLHGKPHLQSLEKNDAERTRVFKGLALEAMRAEPVTFAKLVFWKAIAAADVPPFMLGYFDATYGADLFAESYEELAGKKKLPVLRRLFALGRREPAPPPEIVWSWLAPSPDAPAAVQLRNVAATWLQNVRMFRKIPHVRQPAEITEFQLSPVGWFVVIGALLSFAPWYRRTLGVWSLVILGYGIGVFIIGATHARFFAPAWSVLLILAAIPADVALRLVSGALQRRCAASSSEERQGSSIDVSNDR